MTIYKRLTDKEVKILRRQYYADQLYIILCPVVMHYSESRYELTPVELWTEALRLARELALSPRPDMEIGDITRELPMLYTTLSDHPTAMRTGEDALRTAFLVEMMLLYMLHSPLINKSEEERGVLRKNDVIRHLTRVVMEHSLCRDFVARTTCEEDREEKQDRYVKAFDYLLTDLIADEEVCDSSKVAAISHFIDRAMAYGNVNTMRNIMNILNDMNRTEGHPYDDLLHRMFDWISQRSNEGERRTNNFYGSVASVDCTVDKQLVSEPMTRNQIMKQ